MWDREGALHAGAVDRATRGRRLRAASGRHLCEAADPQAKGVVERLQGYIETSVEPGRRFANEIDFAEQLDGWFENANRRTHRTLRCRPVYRLPEDRGAMAPFPGHAPSDLDPRIVLRVPPDPYVRVDTCEYSLDPRRAGRRVEVRVSQREITATALDTGEVACRHRRSFARHRTIGDLEHLRLLRARRSASVEPEVEQRPLHRDDALIPA